MNKSICTNISPTPSSGFCESIKVNVMIRIKYTSSIRAIIQQILWLSQQDMSNISRPTVISIELVKAKQYQLSDHASPFSM